MLTSRFLPGGAVELSISPQHPAYVAIAGMLGQAYRDHARDCQAVRMSAAPAPEVPAGDPYKELATTYAALWTELTRQGEEIPDAEFQAARDELEDGNWVVELKGGKWVARPAADDEDPILMSQKRAPKGGVTISGKLYRGGLWIPNEALAKASPEQLKEINDANEGIRQKQRSKREARGPVDVDSLRAKLQPHADAANLHAKENRQHLASAKLMYHALAREHGDLTAHRIEELAEQAERALNELPEEETGKREYFARQLAKLHHAAGMAKERTQDERQDKSPIHSDKEFAKAPAAHEGEIPSLPGLGERDREVENRAKTRVLKDYPALRDEYLKDNAVRDADGSIKSVVLNTDEWRGLFDGYTGTNAAAVHEPASYANKKLLAEMYDEQKGKGNNRLAIYAGGGGSGKGTAIGQFFNEADYPLRVDQVTDNFKKAEALLDTAKKKGYDPEYIFVDRQPEAAWNGVVGRAVSLRAKGELARTVPLQIALKANIEARKVALEMLEKRPDIRANIIDNRDNANAGGRRLITDPEEATAFLKARIAEEEQALSQGLHEKLHADVVDRYRQGKIPEDIAAGLVGHETIAAAKTAGKSSAKIEVAKGANHVTRKRVPESEAVPPDDAAGAGSQPAEDDRRDQLRRPAASAGVEGDAERGRARAPGRTEGKARPVRQKERSRDDLTAALANADKLDAKGVGQLAKQVGIPPGTKFKSKAEALAAIHAHVAKPSRDAITSSLQQAYDDDRAGTKRMPTPADYADVKAKPADLAAVKDSVSALATDRDATDLAAVYQHAKQAAPGLTDEQFKGIVGKLAHDKAIRLEPYTRAIATAPHPEHVLPLSGELMYYVRPEGA